MIRWPLWGVFIASLSFTDVLAAQQDVLKWDVLSIQSFPWNSGDRIVGFKIVMAPSRIASVRDIPDDWELEVDNGNAGRTTITAQAHHGASMLSKETDAGFFKDFLRIENRYGEWGECGPGEKPIKCIPFEISGEIYFERYNAQSNDETDWVVQLKRPDFIVQTAAP